MNGVLYCPFKNHKSTFRYFLTNVTLYLAQLNSLYSLFAYCNYTLWVKPQLTTCVVAQSPENFHNDILPSIK